MRRDSLSSISFKDKLTEWAYTRDLPKVPYFSWFEIATTFGSMPKKGHDLKIIVQFHVLHFYNCMTLKAITFIIKLHDFYLKDGFCTLTTSSANAILQ